MINRKAELKLVNNKVTKRSWLVNEKGERITKKFIIESKNIIDNFVHLCTNKGDIVYHLFQDHLLFLNGGSKNNVTVYKLGDNLYHLRYRDKKTKSYISVLYNKYGRLITREYSVYSDKNGMIPVKKDGKYGFIDMNAKLVIPTIYRHVENFNEYGYAVCISTDDKYIVINKNGEHIVETTEYINLEFVSPQLIRVYKAGKYGIININGSVVIPAIYYNIALKGDFFIVKYIDEWGLLDSDGNVIFDCIYPKIIETPDKFVVQDFAVKEIPKTKYINKK